MGTTRQNQARVAILIIVVIALIAGQFSSHAREDDGRDAQLLETGKATKLQTPVPLPASIRVVSYNIRWRGGEDLRKLIELFKSDAEIGRAGIIGLQEVDRNKRRTGNVNTAKQMAEELGMYYAWAAPPPPPVNDVEQEEETGVAILSAYPLIEAKRLVLPNEGPGGRRRAALGATIKIGDRSVRVYSVHAEIRMSNKKRLEQFKAVLDDLQNNHAKVKHAIVLGDFNTLMGKDVDATTKLFTTANFSTPFSSDLATWKTFLLKLKLDWFWLRGLRATAFGIDKKIGLSDHWPLWSTLTLSEEKQEVGAERRTQ